METPQVLLDHHLRALRLPTFLREYDKVAQQCAAEGVDYPRYLLRLSEQELLDRITGLLGGRVAEEIYFQQITSGAQDDLEKATHIAQVMVCELGMSKKLGHLTFGKKDRQVFLGRDLMRERDYSEQTALLIDEEVRRIVDSCYERAQKIVKDNKDNLRKLSERLLECETLDGDEARRIVGLPEIKRHDLTPNTPADATQAQSS